MATCAGAMPAMLLVVTRGAAAGPPQRTPGSARGGRAPSLGLFRACQSLDCFCYSRYRQSDGTRQSQSRGFAGIACVNELWMSNSTSHAACLSARVSSNHCLLRRWSLGGSSLMLSHPPVAALRALHPPGACRTMSDQGLHLRQTAPCS